MGEHGALLALLGANRGLRDSNPGRDTVDGYTHALQCAALAEQAGADDEMVCVALLHDAAKPLTLTRHGEVIAEVLCDRVSERRYHVLRTHGAFQADTLTGTSAAYRAFAHEPWISDARRLQGWDAASFDPEARPFGLVHFASRVKRALF